MISKLNSASPSVTGSFDLAWNNQVISGINASVSESSLRDYLQSLKGIGSLNVQRSKDCAGFKYRVKWVDGGDKLPISVR